MKVSVNELLNIEELDARAVFEGVKYPWEALTEIRILFLNTQKICQATLKE